MLAAAGKFLARCLSELTGIWSKDCLTRNTGQALARRKIDRRICGFFSRIVPCYFRERTGVRNGALKKLFPMSLSGCAPKGIAAAGMKDRARAANLLQSGIIFSVISFLTGIGNLAFQGVMGRHLKDIGDYAAANNALGGLMTLLGLLPSAATFAITHYIAHFNFSGDQARLQGLLLGCRKILFRLTVAGSILAIILVKPLSIFFHFSTSLMLVTLLCALLGLWVSLATAMGHCGLRFKRLLF